MTLGVVDILALELRAGLERTWSSEALESYTDARTELWIHLDF